MRYTEPNFIFTYENLKIEYEKILAADFRIIRCVDYFDNKGAEDKQSTVVNRIDVDFSLKKALPILDMFKELNIKATFFIRLHAPEYNPFSFENYKIIKRMVQEGHEIGYHSEIVDQSVIWNEDAVLCLKRDILILETMLNIRIHGIASHGGLTGYNNLEFWKEKKASDFDLKYEAYDTDGFDLFNNSLYVSDSNWTFWKSYRDGKLLEQREAPSFFLNEQNQLIYLLIHPDTYFSSHFYE